MKIIKALVILVIITLSSCAKIRLSRAERKTNTKAKDDGRGSWDTLFECPGIQISSDNGKTWTGREAVRFAAKQVVEAPSDKNLGIYFTFTRAPSEGLRSIMYQGADANTFYLPYRLVSGKFSWTNPFWDNKSIEGSVTSDAKNNYVFRLNLPYKTLGWFISNDQMAKLCDSINSQRVTHQAAVSKGKSDSTGAAGLYKSKKLTLKDATTKSNDVNAIKASIEQKRTGLAASITTQSATVKTFKDKVSDLEAQLATKRDSYGTELNKLNSMGSQDQEFATMLNDLSTNSKNADALRKSLEDDAGKQAQNLKDAVASLSKEVTEKKPTLDTATNALLDTNDDASLNTALNGIYA